MNFRKTFSRRGAAFFTLTFLVAIPAANAQLAPGAGGYNSEFGTDYRVGMAQRTLVRAPILVLGMRAHTTRGAQQNWIAPRFSDALSRRLASVLGASSPQAKVTFSLAQHGLRADNIGVATFENAVRNNAKPKESLPLRQTLFALRREYSPRGAANTKLKKGQAQFVGTQEKAPLFVLGGDITLSGPLQSDSTQITVSLRVARFHVAQLSAARKGAPVFATRLEPISSVTLRAPAREFAQLPARCVLALSDAMPFSLSSPERSTLLRSASPLTPTASPARIRYEMRVGQAVSHAMNTQFAWTQSKSAPAASRAALLQTVRQAQIALRVLATAPSLPEPDRAAGKEAAQSSREWLASLETILRSAPSQSGATNENKKAR